MQDQKFYEGYSKLVAKVWADPAYFTKLKDDPGKVLSENGIKTKHDAKIYVVKVDPTGHGDFERQVADWAKGDVEGTYYLWIPDKPAALADKRLMDTSTTCTPCTTCT